MLLLLYRIFYVCLFLPVEDVFCANHLVHVASEQLVREVEINIHLGQVLLLSIAPPLKRAYYIGQRIPLDIFVFSNGNFFLPAVRVINQFHH